MSENAIKARRAEILVEAFIEDLKPSRFVKAESDHLDFDFVVAFKKPGGGLKYCAIEVMQTDSLINGEFHFIISRRAIDALNSNMPTIIFVADTKRSQLYYGFASSMRTVSAAHRSGFFEVAVPTTQVEASPEHKRRFVHAVLNS
jgi:hypothetical protein